MLNIQLMLIVAWEVLNKMFYHVNTTDINNNTTNTIITIINYPFI